MRKNEVTKDVMNRVMKYEKGHTYRAMEIWAAMVLGFISLMVLVMIGLIDEMSESGSLDLLSLMINDFEIAKEYGDFLWQTIFYDFPWIKIVETVIISFGLGILFYVFSRRLKSTQAKLAQMKKYFEQMDK